MIRDVTLDANDFTQPSHRGEERASHFAFADPNLPEARRSCPKVEDSAPLTARATCPEGTLRFLQNLSFGSCPLSHTAEW